MNNDSILFRFLTEPTDVNFGGKVHGGAVMKWIDQTGYTCAVNWSNSYCVTVYAGGMRFINPIHIGDIAEVHARIIHTGRSSMHIAVDVKAINPRTKTETKATHCIIIFVAVDDAGKTIPVPEWVPETAEEKTMNDYAKRLIEKRQVINDEMNHYIFTE